MFPKVVTTVMKRALSTSAVHKGAYTWYAAWQMAKTNGESVESRLSDQSSDRGSCPEHAYQRYLEQKVEHVSTEGGQAKPIAEVDINAVIKRGAW